ncbi:MAG: hypothetical protein PHT96_13440 [Syntrophorhabdaceae bacterium]|nr:hypothetical protein [Syntrophorhabdaceae bacterium]MDD4197387.1 hypothetical protein [Syntrophorhabdaceae bacterium]
MNEKKRIFRTMITPVLNDLDKLCRLSGNAFVTIVEVEPGEAIQVSYLPERSIIKQSLITRPDAAVNNEPYRVERLNEENINLVKGIRAERG